MIALAKISRPKLHRAFRRVRLFHLLDQSRERALTWVHGPPGAGKTVLVESYLQARKMSGVWYQVDAGDSDPASFFYYLSRAAPRRCKPLPILTPEYLPNLPGFTQRYFRELFSRLPRPAALVFDNYQEAADISPLHIILREALNEIPNGLRVIAISRSEVPREFTRLQANGALAQVDWEELRLTQDEALGIARLREFSDEQAIRRLHQDADGWAAGLVLEIEQIERSGTKRGASGADSRQAVFNYFATEIFDHAPFEHRRTVALLAQTAFPPYISAAAAIELTGDQEAGKLLEGLYLRHLFIDRRGGPEGVYHYHALFRAFLLEQAKAKFTTEERARIATRAARILESQGEAENALLLYCDARDWVSATRLIISAAPALLGQGRNQTLQAWINGIPPKIRGPWLLYWLGLAVMPFSQPESRTHLEGAFCALKSSRDNLGALLACVAIIDSYFFEWGNMVPMDRWISELELLLASPPRYPSNEVEALVISSGMAMVWRQLGHPLLAVWRDRAMQLMQTDLNPQQRLLLGAKVVLMCMWRGDFAIGRQVIAEQQPTAGQVQPGLGLLMWRVMITQFLWLVGEFEASRNEWELALRMAADTGIHVLDMPLYAQGAHLGLNTGDLGMAKTALCKIKPLLHPARPLDISGYHFLCAAVALRQGDLPASLQMQQWSLDLNLTAGSPYPTALTHFGLAQVLIEMGQHQRAREHINAGRAIGHASKSTCLEHAGRMSEAYLCLQTGEEAQALKLLQQGLSLSGESLLWWLPAIRARLYARALEAGIETDYVRKLIRRYKLAPETPDINHWPWPVKIFTLGEFSLVKDGEPIVFSHKSPKKPIALLKAIVAFGAREVSARQLTDALWSDAKADAAHEALAVNLHRLRKLLGHNDAIILYGGKVSLNAEHCWVDIWAFERLLAETTSGAVDTRASEKALALYRGAFLPAELEEPWALSMRERLRDKFIRHSVVLGHCYEERDDSQAAIHCYQHALDADDLGEALYQGLMRCYLHGERRAEGLAVYRRLRQTLLITLGIKPSAASESLFQVLRAE